MSPKGPKENPTVVDIWKQTVEASYNRGVGNIVTRFNRIYDVDSCPLLLRLTTKSLFIYAESRIKLSIEKFQTS